MQQAIEDRGSHDPVAEDVPLGAEALATVQDHWSPLVAAASTSASASAASVLLRFTEART